MSGAQPPALIAKSLSVVNILIGESEPQRTKTHFASFERTQTKIENSLGIPKLFASVCRATSVLNCLSALHREREEKMKPEKVRKAIKTANFHKAILGKDHGVGCEVSSGIFCEHELVLQHILHHQ